MNHTNMDAVQLLKKSQVNIKMKQISRGCLQFMLDYFNRKLFQRQLNVAMTKYIQCILIKNNCNSFWIRFNFRLKVK